MELLQDDFRIDNSFSESDGERQEQSKNPLIQCGFSTEQAQHIRKLGFHRLTAIQRESLPLLTAGASAIIVSRTGSGKTLAYSLPILKNFVYHRDVAGIRAVVLAPTRELAFQISKVLKQLVSGQANRLRIALLSGGDSLDEQFEQLSGNPDIIVATPGRLQFHMQQIKGLYQLLQAVEYLVIDEADQMFENQLLPYVSEIISCLPHTQTVLCSATMPPQLSDFTKANLKNPKLIQSETETLPAELSQMHLLCNDQDKAALLVHLIQNVFPSSWRILVFVSTRYHAEFLALLLYQQKINAGALYGTMDQEARHITLAAFKQHSFYILISTDVAARGVDIELLECVVNFNFPFSSRTYLHRGGRAARAGRYGLYVNLLDVSEIPYLLDALLHAELPISTMHVLYSWEDINRKFLSVGVYLTYDSLDFKVTDSQQLRANFKAFIERYANEHHAEMEKTESADALRTRFKDLYKDVSALVQYMIEDDVIWLATYLLFLKNVKLLKISPYSAQAFLGRYSLAMSSIFGKVPQALLDGQQGRFDLAVPELVQLQKSMKNSIYYLNKQKKSATFHSCQRATEFVSACGLHPLFEQFAKGYTGLQQQNLETIKHFKISTRELIQRASTGDESAAVQLKMRQLIERKQKMREIVGYEVFGSSEQKATLRANSIDVLRELDYKIRNSYKQQIEAKNSLVSLKPQVKQLYVKDITLEIPRDETATDGMQKKVWDKVKGRWVTQASLVQYHQEKQKMEMAKDGKWRAAPKTKQLYEKWVKKTGQRVPLAGYREEYKAHSIGGRGITQHDKEQLDKQLAGPKKKETKASRISKMAQNATAKGKDWRKEADRKRAKGTRIQDNKWRRQIKKGK